MRSLLVLVVFLLMCGQDAVAMRLRLNGLVTEHATLKPLASARVRIYKDGVLMRASATNAMGKYSITLENQHSYVVRVDAPGHQGKCITLDTHGMEWEGDARQSTVEVEMRLPAFCKDVDLSYFDLPMGMAFFEPATGRTRWSVKYEQSLTAAVRELMGRYDQLVNPDPTMAAALELTPFLVVQQR